jgi:broad specificity phosphatase PhoE
VRHGETEWNKELRVQGVTNVPLNEKGKRQAEACARILLQELSEGQQPLPSTIFSSPMLRASDTAKAIATELSSSINTDTKTIVLSHEDPLREWNLGCLEGLRKEEASTKYPNDWKIFSQWANPLVTSQLANQPITGGGESMEDVRVRAVSCLENLVLQAKDGGTSPIIAVTHGGVLGQLLRHVVIAQYDDDDVDPKLQQQYQQQQASATTKSSYHRPQNACITKFMIHPLTRNWTIDQWADISHLMGDDDTKPIDTNYNASSSK